MTEDMFETDWSFLSGVSVDTAPQQAKTTAKKPARVYQMLGFEYSLSRPHSAESRAKISAGNLGKTRTAETRAKISAALTGVKKTAETRARMRHTKIGGKHTDRTIQHRTNLSDALTGRSFSEEHRANLRARSSKSKSVMTPSGEFMSVRLASETLGVNVAYLMLKGTAGYYYINKEAK